MSDIDKKIDVIANADEAFKDALEGVDNQLAKEIIKIYAKFVVGKNLSINASELAKLEESIIAAVSKTNYDLALNAYIPNFDVIDALNKSIHEDINDIDINAVINENNKIANFKSNVTSKLKGTPTTLIQVTNDAGVVEKIPFRNPSLNELIDPIAEVIKRDVITGISFESATEAMLDAIAEKKLGLSQWAGGIARDALSQADGVTQQAVAESFNLRFFRYIGTIKNSTRPICYKLLTQKDQPVYTDPELAKVLKEYVPNGVPSESTTTKTANGKQQKKGDGIIPGTDVSNFTIRRGGYNCRHQYIPAKRPPVKNIADIEKEND